MLLRICCCLSVAACATQSAPSPAPPAPVPGTGALAASTPAPTTSALTARPVDPPAAPTADSGPAAATVALFVQNCAQCHGEKGDGEGVTQLDRRARSFLDGGFSYGNTQDALLRSITHGIPGTPMPSFAKALTDAQRVELAAYVASLGPEQIVVDEKESEVVVRDEPVIVRGKLPSIALGAPEWPRGLAIGTPAGLTFEYRADDVRLVGVRMGRFLNREDWGGRGGDALNLLGQPVVVLGAGRPGAAWMREVDPPGEWSPLEAHLRASASFGPTATLECALGVREAQAFRVVAKTTETPAARATPLGMAIARVFNVFSEAWSGGERAGFRLRLACHEEPGLIHVADVGGWTVCRTDAERHVAVAASSPDARSTLRVDDGVVWCEFDLRESPRRAVLLPVVVLPLPGWSDAVRASLAQGASER